MVGVGEVKWKTKTLSSVERVLGRDGGGGRKYPFLLDYLAQFTYRGLQKAIETLCARLCIVIDLVSEI